MTEPNTSPCFVILELAIISSCAGVTRTSLRSRSVLQTDAARSLLPRRGTTS
ncbi:hypothetical protein IQ274_34415 [Nostoc sp. LEGE 12447]|uniref:hypothetical protein n=1 Tax=Nostoc sp. LEGE 12447 TaxID=1828640 RepID=UPI001883B956|nr:hypothetical protein [Nostoc sp. LEGE 12447]MBE9003124.1 hypothetical protein [Nostoc sp. LEGE 12447]